MPSTPRYVERLAKDGGVRAGDLRATSITFDGAHALAMQLLRYIHVLQCATTSINEFVESDYARFDEIHDIGCRLSSPTSECQ